MFKTIGNINFGIKSMDQTQRIWIFEGTVTTFNIVNLVLNAVLASALVHSRAVLALRVLLFLGFALSLIATPTVTLFTKFHVQKLNQQSLAVKTTAWRIFSFVVFLSSIAILVTGVAVVWLYVVRNQVLLRTFLSSHGVPLSLAWLGIWVISSILQIMFYAFLGLWTYQLLKTQSMGRLDLDFGIHLPPMDEMRPGTTDTNRSFASQDITLISPPRTPTSRKGSSTRASSSTRVGTNSSRTRLVRGSAKSSLDLASQNADTVSIDSAFDSWDTSSVHREMRAAVHSSPPTRTGLETIPGSRPDSPANALDGPFLPSSPTMSTSQLVTLHEASTPRGMNPTSPFQEMTSTPPASPPNFSRPNTSSSQHKPLSPAFGSSSEDLIHPLFRPSSPLPPPTPTIGTVVTASPLADQPMTPSTLAQLRSKSPPQHWRAMPSVDLSELPSPTRSMAASPGPGSPGPSIIEEEDMPPILPGFVLTAGQRTSLVDYDKRKSLKKERRKSQLSIGSRLSAFLS